MGTDRARLAVIGGKHIEIEVTPGLRRTGAVVERIRPDESAE